MDLKQLRTFLTVAEEGSVSRAALRMHIAQSALSRQIIHLESDLGLKLFDRIGRRLVLTREGERLIQNCRSVLGQAAQLTEQAHLLRGGEVGLLKVAASPQIIESVLATFLPKYEGLYPRVEVKLREAVGNDQLAMLERGDIDIAIAMRIAVRSKGRFADHELPPVEVLAVCHPANPLARRGAIEISALAGQPLLLLDSSYVFRKSFDMTCQSVGLEPVVMFESRGPHTLLALAEAGHGIAIIQTAVSIHRYKLSPLRIMHRGKPIRLHMAAIWDRHRTLPAFATDFCTLLADDIRTQLRRNRSSQRPDEQKARALKRPAVPSP